MKKTILPIFCVCIMVSSQMYAQALEYSENQFLVSFNDELSSSEVFFSSLKISNSFNSEADWINYSAGIAAYTIDSFPFTLPNGNVITDIDQTLPSVGTTTEVDEVSYNYENNLDPSLTSSINCNQNDFSYFIEQGESRIKISILDTGISSTSDNNSGDYDFSMEVVSGYDYVNNDHNPADDHGHGTHLAGIMADVLNRETDHSMVTFDIRKTHNQNGSGYLNHTLKAIIDAVDSGADIINMSFSHVPGRNHSSGILNRVMQYAQDNGVLVVASAGNNGQNNDNGNTATVPASLLHNNIVSVASHGCGHSLSGFSNYGRRSVDLAILGQRVAGPDLGSGIEYKDGTSQAAAIVSGIAAVLGTNQKEFNAYQVKCALMKGSNPSSALHNYVGSRGYVDGINSLAILDSACPFGQGLLTSRSQSVEVFPNPFNDLITINDLPSDEGKAQAILYNIQGQNVWSTEVSWTGNQLRIDNLESVVPGYYMLTLKSSEVSIEVPIVKSR